MLSDPQTTTADFHARRDRELRRHYARKPKKIADVLAQLITTRGYGRFQSDTRPGRIRRGTLDVTVTNSTVVQELTFQKQQILSQLKTAMPDANIRDIRFRIGSIC